MTYQLRVQANNPVYGISNYVDVVPAQNQVTYLDPSQMFTLQQQQQVQQQATAAAAAAAATQQVTAQHHHQQQQHHPTASTTPSTGNQTNEMSVSSTVKLTCSYVSDNHDFGWLVSRVLFGVKRAYH